MKTLVLHIDDRTTDFLKPIYSDIKNKTVYNEYNPVSGDRAKIIRAVEVHDRVILLGHGYPRGMFGFGSLFTDTAFVQALKKKDDNVIYIWCHASDYVINNRLKGFSTGMFISEVAEAAFYGIHATQDQIDYQNNLFVDLVKEQIDNGNTNTKSIKDLVYAGYTSDTCEVIKYNRSRLRYLDGTDEPVRSFTYEKNKNSIRKLNLVEFFSKSFLK